MASEPYKVCPECGGEYRMEIARCADCAVLLATPEEVERRDARELQPRLGLAVLRTAPIAWARGLTDALAAAGIPYGVDRRRARSDGLLAVLVRRQDRPAAEAVAATCEEVEPCPGPEVEARPFAAWARGLTAALTSAGMPDGVDRRLADPDQPPPSPEAPAELESYKTCPRCGGEYLLTAEVCADCGGPLAVRGEVSDPAPEKGEEARTFHVPESLVLPPSNDLVCLCCRSLEAAESLAERLAAADIPHRLDPGPFGPSLKVACLYVWPADADAAAAIDDELFGGAPVEESDRAELATCPACGAEHSPEAPECSSCGLQFDAALPPDVTCERCGAVVAALAGPRCPNCGAALPRGDGP
jgi:hypothetical protein